MRYPVAIETGDAKHAFGVAVPDLPGCFSAGHTLDDALTNSREAILLHLEALLDDEQPFPAPSPISQLQKKRRSTLTRANRGRPDRGFSPARRSRRCVNPYKPN